MRVLVVGAGGREHALAWRCAADGAGVIVAPGNPGTAALADNVAIQPTDAQAVARLARERDVDLVVLGPDAAVAAGVADACHAAGIAVFGPTAGAGRIESSKAFAKHLMDEAGIPTARWRAGGAADIAELRAFIRSLGGACVVKVDGLALGKGVVVCGSLTEAEQALRSCLLERRFGEAGSTVVVEELLDGPELSVQAICDGERVRVLPPARDYKRAGDGDAGPNTGGMGAVAPPEGLDPAAVNAQLVQSVLAPAVQCLQRRGTPFKGCLYAGLMLTSGGPRVLEFNARFGDPETQVILPLLDESLPALLLAAAQGRLQHGSVRAGSGAAVAVVLAAAGYPERPRSGDPITGLDDLDADVLCFQAGTRREGAGLRTAGGRVLSVVARSSSIAEARRRAYANADRIKFDGVWRRNDIGAPRPVRV